MIVLPQRVWESLLDLLLEPEGAVERVGFIDGVIGEVSVATTVLAPRAQLASGFYDVPAGAMSEAGKHLRRYRLQRLAQAHTHAGTWVGHSKRDDQLAYSREDGAVSIVIPEHARHRPAITGCGVHIVEHGYWRQLDVGEVEQFFRVVPSLLNFRRSTPSTLPSSRRRFRRRLPWSRT